MGIFSKRRPQEAPWSIWPIHFRRSFRTLPLKQIRKPPFHHLKHFSSLLRGHAFKTWNCQIRLLHLGPIILLANANAKSFGHALRILDSNREILVQRHPWPKSAGRMTPGFWSKWPRGGHPRQRVPFGTLIILGIPTWPVIYMDQIC